MTPDGLLLRPDLWPLLLAAPLAWAALRALERGRERRVAAAAGPRAGALSPGAGPRRRALATALFAGGLLLALAALLEPAWGEGDGAPEPRGADVVLCLDVSRSMEARDGAGRSRLHRAKEEIRALAARAAGDRLALVLFAGEARLAVPLTTDGAGLAALAGGAEPAAVARGGTDLGAALEVAVGALDPGGRGPAFVVVLTDGEDLEGRGLAAAAAAARRGVVVHAVGLGSPRGAKIPLGPRGSGFRRDRSGRDVVTAMDPAGLRALAGAGGGVFVDGEAGGRPLVEVYQDMILPAAGAHFAAGERRRRTPRFPWPLGAALLLFLVEPWVLRPRRS